MSSLIKVTRAWGGFESKRWLVIPPQESIIYLRNAGKKDYWRFGLDWELAGTAYIAGENIRVRQSLIEHDSFTLDSYSSGGRAAFLVSPKVFRGKIDPDMVTIPGKGFAKYLKSETDIDVVHPLVQKTAQEVLYSVPENKRNNLYWRADAAFAWIKRNIVYSVVPSFVIRRVASVISELPDRLKNDPYEILRRSLNFREDILRRAASGIRMRPEISDPVEKAIKFLEDVDSVWKIFQLGWLGGGCSASATIGNKMAKCLGIANTFVAICRELGIPAKMVVGFAVTESNSGEHAWTVIYLPPYGWAEVDRIIRNLTNTTE